MGFIEDKTETINNVALFEVLGNLPKGRSTSSLDSVTSKNKNLLPFLLDLLSTTCKDDTKNPRGSDSNSSNSAVAGNANNTGTTPKSRLKCETTRILTEILIQFFPSLIRILKEGISQAIKSGLACSVDFSLPTTSLKVKLKISNLDFNDLLKIDPLSDVGSTFYGKNASKDFNWFLNNLVQSGGGGSWKGILDLHYDQTTEEIEFGLNPSYVSSGGGKSFDSLLMDYTDSIEMISLENFMAKITDKLTGAMMAKLANPPSLDKLVSMEQVSALQDKINSSDPCKEEYQIDESYFTFTNDEILKIEEIANQKVKGVTNLDLGCGIVPATVDAQVVKGLFDEIRNAPPSNVSGVINNTIDVLNNSLTNNVPDSDKKVAKLSLNAKMLEEIPKILTEIVLEPKIVTLYQMCIKLVNGPLLPPSQPIGAGGSVNANINVNNGFDYAKATSVFFEYVTRESLAALLRIIFNQAKKEIINLVQGTVSKIIKDRLKLKNKQLEFMLGGTIDGLLSTGLNTVSDKITIE
jgi:hypothetical protein